MIREISPREVARAFGAKPLSSPFTPTESGYKAEISELSRISENITKLYGNNKDLSSSLSASEQKTIRNGAVHVMDRVVGVLVQKGVDNVLLDHMREKNFGEILQQFINESLEYHRLNPDNKVPDGIASIRDTRVVILANGLSGTIVSGSDVAAIENVSSVKKLDLLDSARGNFANAMVNWMLAR